MRQHRRVSSVFLISLAIIGLALAAYIGMRDAYQPAHTTTSLVGRTPRFPVAMEAKDIPVVELAILAGHTSLIDDLIQRGNVFTVANNQQVEILMVDSAGIEVRILQGNQAGRTGWVAHQFVQRLVPGTAVP